MPGVTVTVGGKLDGSLDASLKGAEAAAKRSGVRMGGGFLNGISQAFKGSTSATSQLISVISNTLSSLGSGMSPFRVLMQQGPNIAQAFTLMGGSAMTALRALAPFALVGGVFTAIGLAIYKVGKHFDDLGVSFHNTRQRMGDFGASATTMASEIDKANSRLEEQAEWLKKIKSEYQSLNDVVKNTISVQDELGKIEIEKAKASGATPEKIRQMELDQLGKRFDAISEARKSAKGTTLGAIAEAEYLSEKMSSSESLNRSAELATKQQALEKTLAVIDEIQMLRKKAEYKGFTLQAFGPDDKFKPQSNNGLPISFNEASKQAALLAEEVSDLRKNSNELSSAFKTAKEKAERAKQEEKALDSLYESVKNQLVFAGIRAQLPIASGRESMPLTDRERIGAYAGGGNISLLDVSKKQYAEMVKFNAQMKELKATLENTY